MTNLSRRPGATANLSRRQAVTRLAGGSAALMLAGAAGACAPPAESETIARPGEDDDALLARILSAPQPHIAKRVAPYRVTRTLRIPAGRTVTVAPDTRIVWGGDTKPASGVIGVFEAAGDNAGVRVDGGEAFVECETPSPLVYAAAVRGKRGFTAIGIQARECQHVYVGAAVTDYRAVRTSGPGANVARDVRISGGGARYATLQTTGQGACLITYVAGCRVEDVHYENVPHGIQWWGGDAGIGAGQNGRPENERKCIDVVVERVTVRHAIGGGIWGSMGRRIIVRDCSVEDCYDVGFDVEGCLDTTFERCAARNARNGCFTTFALCDGIRFVDCNGTVDNRAWPLFRVYNVTQSSQDNRVVQVLGGRFECLDPAGPASMDTAMGPVRDLTISGATLRNVRIDVAFFNMHHTRIIDNTLSFPGPLPSVVAIRAGASKRLVDESGAAPASAIVQGNRISYNGPAGKDRPIAIQVRENDFNSSVTSRIADNIVSGPFAVGISVINATGNIGIIPTFEITGNHFSGFAASARLLSVEQEGAYAKRPIVRWDARQTRNGTATGIIRALR